MVLPFHRCENLPCGTFIFKMKTQDKANETKGDLQSRREIIGAFIL